MSSVSVLTYINTFQFKGFILKVLFLKNSFYLRNIGKILVPVPVQVPAGMSYDADPGTGRVFIFILVPVLAGMEVIPAWYRPGQNFDPGRPLAPLYGDLKVPTRLLLLMQYRKKLLSG